MPIMMRTSWGFKKSPYSFLFLVRFLGGLWPLKHWNIFWDNLYRNSSLFIVESRNISFNKGSSMVWICKSFLVISVFPNLRMKVLWPYYVILKNESKESHLLSHVKINTKRMANIRFQAKKKSFFFGLTVTCKIKMLSKHDWIVSCFL